MLYVLRQRHARPWMLLAAMVWLVATFMTEWHEIVVPHARCPEHGELLQVAPARHGNGPELAVAPNDPHHDACAFHQLGGVRLTTLRVTLLAPEPTPPDEVLELASIRLASSALRFAPKTSPPIA